MNTLAKNNWSLTRKVLFRFFFIYLILKAAPWLWVTSIPGFGFVFDYHNQFMDWMVQTANTNLFRIRKVLVRPMGSGDTSWSWAQHLLFVCIALIGCLFWSLVDRKRKDYRELNYWLCLIVRYYVIFNAFVYGLVKMFPMQMPFPNQSQLATPLGDFLPMRLSWMFMGYSSTYQIFAGCMEVLAGILLLNRKTITLGALLALAVFSNVMMMNFSYDIPVKILSMNIVMFCLYLLVNEYDRLVSFFILNKPAPVSSLYYSKYTKMWLRVTRVLLKSFFLIFIVGVSFHQNWQRYESLVNTTEMKLIKSGFYDVAVYVVNRDTIPPLTTDSMRWQNVVFEKNGSGSVKTADTIFRQRYKRAYFNFEMDSIKRTIAFRKLKIDSPTYNGVVLTMRYQIPDSTTIQLWGKEKYDSLYILLKRSNRHFQLSEKQFHWLSEYNR